MSVTLNFVDTNQVQLFGNRQTSLTTPSNQCQNYKKINTVVQAV